MPKGERVTKPVTFFSGAEEIGLGTMSEIALAIRGKGLNAAWENNGYGPMLSVWMNRQSVADTSPP